MIDIAQQKARAEALIAAKVYKDTHKREFPPKWYAWQQRLFDAPIDIKQKMLLAANRVGKTFSAGYYMGCHLTQDYPENWKGFKFDHAITSIAGGVDNTQLKDVVQRELFGDVVADDKGKRFTGGWVHPHEIVSVEWNNQVTNLARKIMIKGQYGLSSITLRAYSQSKTGSATLSFAGTSQDLIWIDECPPDALVGQLVTRTMTGNRGKGGHILYTMTPELGVTNLVQQFMEELLPGQMLIGPIAWDECAHLTPEVQAQILSGLPPHEHDMRSKGTPFFGTGLVFPIAEDRIKIEPFDLTTRPWMRGIKGLDIGTTHPTAIAWVGYDPEDDTIYVVKGYKKKGEAAAVHAAAANAMWKQCPTIFPHDVDQTEPGSGKTARYYYEIAGLYNTYDFKNPDGSIYIEPGIMDMYERMLTNRFKVFSDCEEFWQEFRMYHREDGKIVDKNDDMMSAVRYAAIMAPNYAVDIAFDRIRRTKVTGRSARIEQ